ncbi:hypothetical protein HDU91_005004 [Kappamyces sp. JEL0680]|nr:hypothetical protein HDU91_005004 [Kappamyces sp. JEL0680]
MNILQLERPIRANVYCYLAAMASDADLQDHQEILQAAAVLVACKQHNKSIKVRDIVNAFFWAYHQTHLPINSMFWKLRDSLIRAEFILLRAIGFQSDVDNPYADYAATALEWRILDRPLLQTGICILNDCMHLQELCLLLVYGDAGQSRVRQVSWAVLGLAWYITSSTRVDTPDGTDSTSHHELVRKKIAVFLTKQNRQPEPKALDASLDLALVLYDLLHSLCDYRYYFVGCDNPDLFLSINSVLFRINLTITILGTVYVLDRLITTVIQKRKLKTFWNIHVTVTLAYYILPNQSEQELLNSMIAVNIYEGMNALFGLVGIFSYSDWVVTRFAGVSRKASHPSFVQKLSHAIHLFLFLVLIVLMALFCIIGTQNYDQYILWRRISFAYVGFLYMVVEPVMLYFGGVVIMTQVLEQTGTKKERIKAKVAQIRSAVLRVSVFAYFPTGAVLVLIPILNEVLLSNQAALVGTKIMMDSLLVFANSVPAFNYSMPVLYKLLFGKAAKRPGSDSSEQNRNIERPSGSHRLGEDNRSNRHSQFEPDEIQQKHYKSTVITS